MSVIQAVLKGFAQNGDAVGRVISQNSDALAQAISRGQLDTFIDDLGSAGQVLLRDDTFMRTMTKLGSKAEDLRQFDDIVAAGGRIDPADLRRVLGEGSEELAGTIARQIDNAHAAGRQAVNAVVDGSRTQADEAQAALDAARAKVGAGATPTSSADNVASVAPRQAQDYASRATNLNLHARAYSGLKGGADALRSSGNGLLRAGGHVLNVGAESVYHAKWALPSFGVGALAAHYMTDGKSTEIAANMGAEVLGAGADVIQHFSPELAAMLERAAPEAAREFIKILHLPTDALATIISVGADKAGIELPEHGSQAVAQFLEGDILFAALPMLAGREMSESEMAEIAVGMYRAGEKNRLAYLSEQLGIGEEQLAEMETAMQQEHMAQLQEQAHKLNERASFLSEYATEGFGNLSGGDLSTAFGRVSDAFGDLSEDMSFSNRLLSGVFSVVGGLASIIGIFSPEAAERLQRFALDIGRSVADELAEDAAEKVGEHKDNMRAQFGDRFDVDAVVQNAEQMLAERRRLEQQQQTPAPAANPAAAPGMAPSPVGG